MSLLINSVMFGLKIRFKFDQTKEISLLNYRVKNQQRSNLNDFPAEGLFDVCFLSFITQMSQRFLSFLETVVRILSISVKSSSQFHHWWKIIHRGIFQGFLTTKSHEGYFEMTHSHTWIQFICVYVFEPTSVYSSFYVIVRATVSVKPRGVGLVCHPQQDAEIPSSRFVTANRSKSRGRTPRHETGSSNSPPLAVHLSGPAPSYVKQDSSWCLDFRKPPIDLCESK